MGLVIVAIGVLFLVLAVRGNLDCLWAAVSGAKDMTSRCAGGGVAGPGSGSLAGSQRPQTSP